MADKDAIELIDKICALKNEAAVHDGDTVRFGTTDNDARRVREHLNMHARKLILTLQKPNMAVWDTIRRCAILSPIKILQDVGVFRYLAGRESATAKELATELGAEESLLIRMIRPLVAEGLFSEVGEEVYSLTVSGSPYALPAFEDSITFSIAFMPVVMGNPSFFRNYGYREPVSHDGLNTPMAAYFQKPGYGFFDYLKDNPDIQKVFASSMGAHTKSANLSSSVYPYGEKLLLKKGEDETGVAIVDVAGGTGVVLQEILNRYPGIKGRMVTQDLQATFDTLTEKPQRIELMAHDIFTEQPIKGASAYHLKRILHDWSDGQSLMILKNIVSAMENGHSKLLVMDSIIPSTSATFSQAMGDHSMMTFGGKERNERQWRELLSSAGLKIVQIYVGPEPEALIECEKV
ncbi:hypothetical protein LOZ51_001860 [Ophidiomyces ophidiicola]|nr:hypothetical protein LOZ55_001221 [Ophidiomyces ophidiicola]KAI1992635.1 hypothetical protein LOZ54_001603 [Ophidiomyces ophidiicola]KAI1999373.1 hypothetical protein LOZ51_001860 [Ophidiomyces ophidiicola]